MKDRTTFIKCHHLNCRMVICDSCKNWHYSIQIFWNMCLFVFAVGNWQWKFYKKTRMPFDSLIISSGWQYLLSSWMACHFRVWKVQWNKIWMSCYKLWHKINKPCNLWTMNKWWNKCWKQWSIRVKSSNKWWHVEFRKIHGFSNFFHTTYKTMWNSHFHFEKQVAKYFPETIANKNHLWTRQIRMCYEHLQLNSTKQIIPIEFTTFGCVLEFAPESLQGKSFEMCWKEWRKLRFASEEMLRDCRFDCCENRQHFRSFPLNWDKTDRSLWNENFKMLQGSVTWTATRLRNCPPLCDRYEQSWFHTHWPVIHLSNWKQSKSIHGSWNRHTIQIRNWHWKLSSKMVDFWVWSVMILKKMRKAAVLQNGLLMIVSIHVRFQDLDYHFLFSTMMELFYRMRLEQCYDHVYLSPTTVIKGYFVKRVKFNLLEIKR